MGLGTVLLLVSGYWATQVLRGSGVALPGEGAGETALALVDPLMPEAASAEAAPPAPPPVDYEKEIQPLLAKYCIDCHGPEKQRAGLELHEYADAKAILKDRKTWEKVLRMVQISEMPPPKQPQFAPEEKEKFLAWVDHTINDIDCTGTIDPGRVTIRRLNRNEYNNTIRDLIGVNFQPADDFPSDDVGYGFDNIGDVLSLPTILLEKYLTAAENITDAAIRSEDLVNGPLTEFAAAKIGHRGAQDVGNAAIMTSSGEVFTDFDFPSEGEYVFRARAFGHQAGPDPARMAFRLDGKELYVADVTAEEGDAQVYSFRGRVPAGRQRVALAFTNDYYQPNDPDPNNRDRNLIIETLQIQGPINPNEVPLPESHRRLITRTPAKDNSDAAECAAAILEPFVTRAFRRPVAPEELTPLVDLVQQVQEDGESFERGIQIAIQAVLVSPHFLFRIETDPEPDNPAAIHDITEYELASRLSYFLWSTMPDDTLSMLAKEGRLRAELPAQVRRMVQDPKSEALVSNFAGQWLQLRNLKLANPDVDRFPAFTPELRAAMAKETELFFTAVMRENRSVLDLIDSDFTFLNEPLAKHYGIPNVTGEEFRRVSLKNGPRGGVLTQASVLTVTSNPTRTSPVKRGKWILENILGAPPPPPPPNVPELEEEAAAALTGTLRERMEQHRANPSCASCHVQMDALGFGFENFDAIGAWRTKDGRFDLDASGELPGGVKFNGPAELKKVLRQRQDEFSHCLAEKMLTYALGRGLEYYDKCALDRITAALKKDEHRFSTLILEVVQSDPFQKRRGKGPDE